MSAYPRIGVGALSGNFGEGLTGLDKSRLFSAERIEAPHGDIDEARREFAKVRDPIGLLGRDQRRAAAAEAVEHGFSRCAGIE